MFQRKTIQIYGLSLIVIIMAFGCTSSVRVSKNISTQRFESPEIHTKQHGVFGGYGNGTTIVLTEDLSDKLPDAESPEFKDGNLTGAGYEYAFSDWVELSVGTMIEFTDEVFSNSILTPQAKVKVQILGDPKNKSTPGNISLAITGGVAGAIGTDSDETTSCLNGCDSTYYEHSTSWIHYDQAAILGVRVSEEALLYGGVFRVETLYYGTWRERNRDSKELISEGSFEGGAITNGYNLGFFLLNPKNVFYMGVEAAWAHTQAGNSSTFKASQGLRLGWNF